MVTFNYKQSIPRVLDTKVDTMCYKDIKLQLQHVTITQLIDIAENIPPEQKICGIHRIFFAPEVVKNTGKPVTAKKLRGL